MKFFEKQKVDPIGHASVVLQKVLLTNGFCVLLLALSGVDLFSVLISFIMNGICFYGAYKRKESFLRFVSKQIDSSLPFQYYLCHVILAILFVVFLCIGFVVYNNSGNDSSNDNSVSVPYNETNAKPEHRGLPVGPALPHARPHTPHHLNQDTAPPVSPTVENTTVDTSNTTIPLFPTPSLVMVSSGFPIVFFLFIFFVVVVVVLKILSILLAWRISKMLRALANLNHPIAHRPHAPSPIVYTALPVQPNGYMPYIAQQMPVQQYGYMYNPYVASNPNPAPYNRNV